MGYQVLIIGCGAIAGGYDSDRPGSPPPLTHAGAYSQDGRFQIAACIEPDDAARSAFADRWGVPRHAASLDALGAAAHSFDVVSICSPTSFHAEHIEAALALKPRLIFCEKPIANDPDVAQRLVAACEAAGVSLAVNYTRRWAPDLVALAREVQGGEWGRLLAATGWYTKGIVHNGGHLIDLMRMFAGDLYFQAAGLPVFDHWEHDPSVPALLANDRRAAFHLVAGDARAVTQFELVLSCEKGEIAMRDGGFRIETRRVADSDNFAGYRTLGAREERRGRYEDAMTCAVAGIADHLDSAKPLASTGTNALAAQRLSEAIRNASLQLAKESSKQ